MFFTALTTIAADWVVRMVGTVLDGAVCALSDIGGLADCDVFL